MKRTYHPEAEAELLEAARYYEQLSRGLGGRFLDDFETAVDEIQRFPTLWSAVEGEIRSHTLSRFPFGIYYRVLGNELRILVVKHHRRHEDYWRHRSEE